MMNLLTCIASLCLVANPAAPVQQDAIFVAGANGYHNYRIPSLTVTTKGTVLAFAEGRAAMSDTGNVDVVMRRSVDGGRTWGELKVVAEDGANTVGNPCAVVDRRTGVVHLLLNWNLGEDDLGPIIAGKSKDTRRIWATRSEDDGLTWSKPIDLTREVKPKDWTWHATGPGCGIQLESGRLVIPCDHIDTQLHWGAHILYSDDGGKKWQLGGIAGPKVNECQVAQRADGTLVLNLRNWEMPRAERAQPQYRQVCTSKDEGLTWSAPQPDRALLEPICQAALLRYPDAKRDWMLFSNPASSRRTNMVIRLSDDGGATWAHARVLHAGPTAYSALAVNNDGEVLCLYERGERHPHETITLARFPLSWLETAPASAPAARK